MVKSLNYSEKNKHVQRTNNLLFGVDFHDFIQKEQQSTVYELATEFGLTYKDVRELRRQLKKL